MSKRLLAGLCAVSLHALAEVGLPGGILLPLPGMTAATPFAASALRAPTVNPYLTVNPLAAGPYGAGALGLAGLAHPALQMTPNWVSHQHLLYMTNPYLGGPAAGNPYLQPSLPLPFAPPAFSPSLPIAGSGQPGMRWPAALSPAPSLPVYGQPSNPYLPAASGPAFPLPLDPTGWLGPVARPPGR